MVIKDYILIALVCMVVSCLCVTSFALAFAIAVQDICKNMTFYMVRFVSLLLRLKSLYFFSILCAVSHTHC